MTNTDVKFSDLKLPETILKTLDEIGYEVPSPIQAQAIPFILAKQDILGMAQTGTGKTAAFALPILANINIEQKNPQVLVLAPTRELAIQVAEAFQTFARNMKGLHILPIYGGADYSPQIKALKRGVHVVVGTPGRVMDHIKKTTLKLNDLTNLVLDEADEMLQMGFLDDVEWVLERIPETRQTSLFSATMPKEIRRIIKNYLNNPKEVIIKQKTATATNIDQKYWLVSGLHKLDALTRILECAKFDAIIIFTKTKTGTVELAEKLSARGYAADALNGDIAQNNRELIIKQLKKGKIDILVATDVAARGLDVSRVSHIINYDIPHDAQSYIHRIGRTGRAGRSGTAILFVSPREQRMLKIIERATKKDIEPMVLPTAQEINAGRVTRFKDKIIDATQDGSLDIFQKMIEEIQHQNNIPAIEIAAGLAKLYQGNSSFFLSEKPIKDNHTKKHKSNQRQQTDTNIVRYRLAVGKKHDVKASNIIGCIANEAGIDGKMIKNLSIEQEYSFLDLPNNLSEKTLAIITKAWVCGQQLNLSTPSLRPSRGKKSFAKRKHNTKDNTKHTKKHTKKPHRKGHTIYNE